MDYDYKLFRDPIHGFIYVSPEELRIIDSRPFQRLRRIRQLALTNLVYHGAEHTRFAHSLGVMHLVSRVFDIITSKNNIFSEPQKAWYKQILRLIGLIHDLGHAPFSHGSEDVLPAGLKHEDFTEKIVCETEIAEYINNIGVKFCQKFGSQFNITKAHIRKKLGNIWSGMIIGCGNI
ncbi:HD domain-containing protein [Thermosyntropha sp.]|uniref:HD domain-containing protein n=1 Tax=Thermosyntropha sp. TaxID=2740820 RepID=UPI0025EF417C|nr:HD domain-containing protein [Thermosyntropha sp.]